MCGTYLVYGRREQIWFGWVEILFEQVKGRDLVWVVEIWFREEGIDLVWGRRVEIWFGGTELV